jgi:FMN phosphatase YigB (HAD superfamily)
MKYKAIIFDYDDTLVKTKETKWDALKETGKRYYKLDISDATLHEFWGFPYISMLQGVFGNVDNIENIRDKYEKVTKEFPMLAHDNCVNVVSQLLKKYKVGILTASSRNLVIDDLTVLGFPINNFFYIQTSEDTNVHKPNPKVFKPMLNKLEVERIFKSEVLYIGDSMKDYQAATDAEIDFIAIDHSKSMLDQYSRLQIRAVDSFNALLKAL